MSCRLGNNLTKYNAGSQNYKKPPVNKPTIGKTVSSPENKQKVQESERWALRIGLGCILVTSISVAAWLLYDKNAQGKLLHAWRFLRGSTNADEVATRTEKCVHWMNRQNMHLQGMCCANNFDGASEECRNSQKKWIEEQLLTHPNAWFEWWSPTEDFDKLSPIAESIEKNLRTLASMKDSNPEQGLLNEKIAKQLFIELPTYCKSIKMPDDMFLNGEKVDYKILLAKELDYLYDKTEDLLTKDQLSSLWRAFALSTHPDKGGDPEAFREGDALVRECLKQRIEGLLSCRWPNLGKKTAGS